MVDQSADFVKFSLDDQEFEVDVLAAHDAMCKVDLKHAFDAWLCFGCKKQFPAPGLDADMSKCPECGSGEFWRDQIWLDSVAEYVRSLGAKRCSRRAAGEFYSLIIDTVEGVKKKPEGQPD